MNNYDTTLVLRRWLHSHISESESTYFTHKFNSAANDIAIKEQEDEKEVQARHVSDLNEMS